MTCSVKHGATRAQSAEDRQLSRDLSGLLRTRKDRLRKSSDLPTRGGLAHELRRKALALTELEASAVISLAPGCPRWASRRVDALTARRDWLVSHGGAL